MCTRSLMDKTTDSGSVDGGSIPLGYSWGQLENNKEIKDEKGRYYGHGKKTKKLRKRIPE